MEKLLKLINEYDDSTFDEPILEEGEPEWIIIPHPVWKEYRWHLWFNNADIVRFPDEMFDYYACSHRYGFIQWLVENKKIQENYADLIQELATKSNPVKHLIWLLEKRWN